jgi:hypothetical protein
MGFLPINILMAILFLFSIIWGWEGEEMRQFFAVISSFFMFPLWWFPLFSITNDAGCCTIVTTNGWLPTFILTNALWWNVALMYFTGAHLMETMGRIEPIGKALKRLRKAR